jgi:hypothetical protein
MNKVSTVGYIALATLVVVLFIAVKSSKKTETEV